MGSTTFWKLNLWCAFITSPCFSSGFFLLLLPPTYILRRWLKIHTLQKSSFLVEFFKLLLLLGFASCRVFCSQNVRHEIHFLKHKIFTVEMKGTFRVIHFQILYIFLPFLTSPEKFSSTLKWPWLETKTEKSKQHFYVAKKKSFWLPQLVKGNNIRSKALWPFLFFASNVIQNQLFKRFMYLFCLWYSGEAKDLQRCLDTIKILQSKNLVHRIHLSHEMWKILKELTLFLE